jgi:hypothetical protein
MTMLKQAAYALAHPVYDPETQITEDNYWFADRGVTACLTVNVGVE